MPQAGNEDSRRTARLGLFVLLWLVPTVTALAADKTYSPIERMTRERLKATHDDAVRIQGTRQTVPPLPGLNDYRAIFHAHAEDSAHTGGTRPEMLEEAKKAGVNAIFLSDHHRPPKDFVNDSWRGVRDGVLFVPGSEDRGFLILPTHSIMTHMGDPTPRFIEAVKDDGGLIFLSHIEERPEHSMEGLDGLEIYNRHYDAKNDKAGVLSLMLAVSDPHSLADLSENLRLYPDELFASQVQRADVYLAKWDAETKTRRLTGVAANDCHHNMILIVKMVDAETVLVGTNVDRDDQMRTVKASLRPGIRELLKGKKPGDVVAKVDLDPYHRSFRNVSTHLLATELTETAMREALRKGRAYVSHDWACDPLGFRFTLAGADGVVALMGDEVKHSPGATIEARFPVVCRIKLYHDGRLIAERAADTIEQRIEASGVYRVEGWLEVGGESRGWLYSNPIYVR